MKIVERAGKRPGEGGKPSMMRLTRREALAAALGAGVAACATAAPLAQVGERGGESGNAIARRRRRRLGSSVGGGRPGGRTGSLADPRYRELLAGQCGLVVPENELKWASVRPTPDSFDFTGADRIIAFAEENRLAVRG